MMELPESSKVGLTADPFAQTNFSSVKSKVESLQAEMSAVAEELNRNIKEFDLITVEKKQSIQILDRNLDDIEKICMAEKDKFKEEINRSLQHNQAVWDRLNNDVSHLKGQQHNLRSKLMNMDTRLAELDGQIGKSSYF